MALIINSSPEVETAGEDRLFERLKILISKGALQSTKKRVIYNVLNKILTSSVYLY